MQRVRRAEIQRRQPGRAQRRGDLLRDVAGLADAEREDLARRSRPSPRRRRRRTRRARRAGAAGRRSRRSACGGRRRGASRRPSSRRRAPSRGSRGVPGEEARRARARAAARCRPTGPAAATSKLCRCRPASSQRSCSRRSVSSSGLGGRLGERAQEARAVGVQADVAPDARDRAASPRPARRARAGPGCASSTGRGRRARGRPSRRSGPGRRRRRVHAVDGHRHVAAAERRARARRPRRSPGRSAARRPAG